MSVRLQFTSATAILASRSICASSATESRRRRRSWFLATSFETSSEMESASIAAHRLRVVPGASLQPQVRISSCCAELAIKTWKTLLGDPTVQFQMFPIMEQCFEMKSS